MLTTYLNPRQPLRDIGPEVPAHISTASSLGWPTKATDVSP
jgi:hypothetical protein